MKPITSFRVTIPGRPIAWARTASAGGRRITPARYRQWKQLAASTISLESKFARFDPETELRVAVHLHKDRTEVAVVAADDRHRPGTGIAGDLDNYAKAVLDALQESGLIADDKAVTYLEVTLHPATKGTK